jgi:phage portal protein BeeE
VELWLLRPDRVKVVPDRDNYISHYEYNNGTGVDNIAAEDIIHLRTRHPFNDFYGMPPLMAAAGRVDIDNFMRDVVKGFLANSGVPAGILRLRAQVSEQDKALFRSRFRTDFGGGNAGNVMVVTGDKDSADYTPLALPLGARGLVIPELDEIDEARIPMVYRVPPSILGSRLGMNSSSYGNRKSDREEFTQRQLVPEWQSVGSALTQSLLPEFGGADFLAFDQTTVAALQQDMDAVSKRIMSELGGGARSLQESRKALGLSPEPDPNDTFLIPTNYAATPVSILESGAPPAAPLALPAGTQEGATRSLGPEVIVINQQRAMRKRVEYDAEGRPIGTVEEPIE